MTFLSTLPFTASRTRFKIHLCYCFLNHSLLKRCIQKICTHDNSKFLYPNKYPFYFLNRISLEQPLKNTKSPISTPKIYNDHPNIRSAPPPSQGQ